MATTIMHNEQMAIREVLACAQRVIDMFGPDNTEGLYRADTEYGEMATDLTRDADSALNELRAALRPFTFKDISI